MGKLTGKFYSPTPQKWRKIGDSILYGLGALGATGLVAFDDLKEVFNPHQLKIIIGIIFILSFVGKCLSDFFKDDTPESKAKQGICPDCQKPYDQNTKA